MATAKPRSTAAKKGAGIGAALVALATICGISVEDAGKVVTDVQQHESGGRLYLKAYLDSVGVPTICDGIIRFEDGTPVKLGDTATPERCQALVVKEVLPRARALVGCAPMLRGRTNQLRALIDLSYNVGTGGVCTGSVGRAVRAGDWAVAGRAILAFDRGTFPRPQRGPHRDCLRKKNGRGWSCRIPGLTTRRLANRARFDMLRPAEGVTTPAGPAAA